MQPERPRGRRPAGSDTRGAIVAAARDEFAERAFGAASMRSIARRAGVDPALVRHYFPDKDELFAVSVLPQDVEPRAVAARITAGGLPGLGARLVTEVLTLWGEDGGARLRAVYGAIAAGDERTQAFIGYLSRAVFQPLVEVPGAGDRSALRVNLLTTQMMGVLSLRFVLRLEPIASMPVAQVAAIVGPTIDRYLTGPLDDAD